MLDVCKTVNQDTILKGISLSFFYGAKIGVLGLNGSGKSTLLRIIAGEDPNYTGEITFQKGLRFGYLPQEPKLDETLSVKENVELAVAEIKNLLIEFDEISMKMAEPMDDDALNTLMERQAELQDEIEAKDAWDLDRKLDIAADALRLPAWDADITKLSGGEKRRVALCKLLLSAPDVLLLDEPTNHLDAESVAWLEQYLHRFPGTVIAVTHDRYFLDNVAGWILELDRGQGIPFEGNYSSWLEQKEQRLDQESKDEQAHQKAVKAELEWVKKNPKGRRKKNKARLQDFEELSSREFQKRNETQSLYIPPGQRLGTDVISLKEVSKRFEQKVLIDNLSFTVPRGAIVGIIGPNGAGKTTLFKMIASEEKPDSGEVHHGETVELGYVNQSRGSLEDKKTVWEEISDGLDEITVGQFTMPSRAYVGRFNFKGANQQKRIGTLSGGERNRVHLAKLLRQGSNVLLLDEPTNDLDVETLRALEEAILAFPGCVFVISHDRWFLDRIATHIIAFEGNSEVEFFEGSYTEYEATRKAKFGDAATQPHRIKYKEIQEI
ncbi:MAG: energy-dependent translational throttle protein EttA [Legionellales bacterium]|nr:energy-dependent translational throttle protein EttA [Legionellales bacterium]